MHRNGADEIAMEQIKAKIITMKIAVKRIGVVSDTHIPTRGRSLPGELFSVFDGVDLVVHAGDIVEERVLAELRAIAPVEAVAGNMDPHGLHRKLGRKKLIKTSAVKIGVIHGDGARKTTVERSLLAFRRLEPQVVIFGHSHRPHNELHAGVLMFNPGSAVDPRHLPRRSCGILSIEGASVTGEIIYL